MIDCAEEMPSSETGDSKQPGDKNTEAAAKNLHGNFYTENNFAVTTLEKSLPYRISYGSVSWHSAGLTGSPSTLFSSLVPSFISSISKVETTQMSEITVICGWWTYSSTFLNKAVTFRFQKTLSLSNAALFPVEWKINLLKKTRQNADLFQLSDRGYTQNLLSKQMSAYTNAQVQKPTGSGKLSKMPAQCNRHFLRLRQEIQVVMDNIRCNESTIANKNRMFR